MTRSIAFILSVCTVLYGLQLSGCETPTDTDSEYDKVSREIERLKAESEAAVSTGGNIRIVVNMLTVSSEDRFAIDSLWRYTNQNVTIAKRPQAFSTSGLKIGLATGNFKARLDITKQQLKSSEETELFIVLADGATGYINVGKEIYLPRFYYFNRWYSAVNYDFRRAGRSLRVTARKLASGLIEMELTPVFSRFLSNGGDLELTELTTKVSAKDGQTLIIGGGDTSAENVSTALLGYSKQGRQKQTLITVTPHAP